jgi:hypothetical protein
VSITTLWNGYVPEIRHRKEHRNSGKGYQNNDFGSFAHQARVGFI